MGLIANQMLAEFLFKMKQRLLEKDQEKQQKKQNQTTQNQTKEDVVTKK